MTGLRASAQRRLALKEWKKVTGYAGRRIVARGRNAVLTAYDIPCGSSELDGKKILFFSDLHWTGNPVIAEDLKRFVAESHPDWLIFGGDLVNYSCYLDTAEKLLREIQPGHDALAVVGNWDRRRWSWYTRHRWETLIAGTGFKLLCNAEYRNRGIRFWGMDDYKLGCPEYRSSSGDDSMSVVISHNPDTVMDITENYNSIDLILCGHTHAGQIRLPLFGAIQTSSDYWRKFDYGHYIHAQTGTHLIVTAGLGNTWFDIRFCCTPEAVLLTFRHKNKQCLI